MSTQSTDKWEKQTARLVLHYLMEIGGEDLCLAFAQDSDHLAEEAELIQCGEYAEPLSERLVRIIADYYEICALVLRAIHRLTPAEKRPLTKMEIVDKLQYLLGSQPAATGSKIAPNGAIKRRTSMYAEVRTLPRESDDAEDDNRGEIFSGIDSKRRRLDEEAFRDRSSTSAGSGSTRTGDYSIPKHQQTQQNKENLPENNLMSKKTEHSVAFKLPVETQPLPRDDRTLDSAPASSQSEYSCLTKETVPPPCSDRLSLGAHLSPIQSTSTTPIPVDSIYMALLENEAFQQTLAENINKCIPAEAPKPEKQSQLSGAQQRYEEKKLSDQLEAAVQNIIELTDKDNVLDDIIDCIVEANHPLPSALDQASTSGTSQNLNESIPGSLTSSTPQKKMSLLRSVALNKPRVHRKKKVKKVPVALEEDAPELDEENESAPRLLRPRHCQKSIPADSSSSHQKHRKSASLEKLKTHKEQVDGLPQVGQQMPVARVNILANESYNAEAPFIVQYLTATDHLSSLEYVVANRPTPSADVVPPNHEKLVIKPPADCNYPMFNTTPLTITLPVPAPVEPKVEYIIPLPTPQKSPNHDPDITFGDSLSKLLIPHSTKRFQSPPSGGESDRKKKGGDDRAIASVIRSAAKVVVSTDKEASVPRVISQTPKLTSIVNQKTKCSSTPRKTHVRMLFNTPNKGTTKSPRPSTLAKMDGYQHVTTPVLCTDPLDCSKFENAENAQRSSPTTRSASKEAAAAKDSKDASTPRVPKTIKKRILSGLEKVAKVEEEGPTEAVAEKSDSPRMTRAKSRSPAKQKKAPEETPKSRSVEKASPRRTITKSSKKKAVAKEPETRSDWEKWEDARKASKSREEWESAVRLQMSTMPLLPRIRRKKRKTAVLAKKKHKQSEGIEEEEGEEEEEEELESEDENEATEQVNDRLDAEKQGNESQPVDLTETTVGKNDTSVQQNVSLPNLNASVVPAKGHTGLPNLNASSVIASSTSINAQLSSNLPNSDPCTPAPDTAGQQTGRNLKTTTREERVSEGDKKAETSDIVVQSTGSAQSSEITERPVTTTSNQPPTVPPQSLTASDTDDHLTRALSPKKRILQKEKHRQSIEESARNTPILNRVSSLPPPHTHISPPPPTHSTFSTSLDTSRNLGHDASLFLETPFKQGCDLIPKTPGFAIPHATPATKIVKTVIDQNVSVLKCPEIPTPDFAITPGAKMTPEPPAALADSQGNRATDYSSGSSYYRPDDSEENKMIELRLAEQLQMRKEVVAVSQKDKEVLVMSKTEAETVLQDLEDEISVRRDTRVTREVIVQEMRLAEPQLSESSASEGELEEGEAAFSSSSSSSFESSSSSDSSSEESDNDMDISGVNANARKVIAENGVLDVTSHEIRFVKGKSETPRKAVVPKVDQSQQCKGARTALTRVDKDAKLFADLEEKKRRMAEKLKGTTTSASPAKKAVSAPAQVVKSLQLAANSTVGSSAGRRKTSTPRKIVLLESLDAMRAATTPRRESVEGNQGLGSSGCSGGGLVLENVNIVRREVSASAAKKVYDNLFGDLSDSETDPTPVKRADQEVFKTPRVEDKYQKTTASRSTSKVEVTISRLSSNKKATEAVIQEVAVDAEPQKSVEEKVKSPAAVAKEVAEREMGPPDTSSASSSGRIASEKDLRTPDAPIMNKRRRSSVADLVEVDAGPSTSTTRSRAKRSRTVKEPEKKPPPPPPPPKPLPKGSVKAPRKGIIALSELPNEGSLERKKTRATRTKSAPAKAATIVRKKAGASSTREEASNGGTKKPTTIRDYLAAKKEPKTVDLKAFKIPKKNVGAEEGEIVEDDSEPVVVDRVSEIPEEIEPKAGSSSGGSSVNRVAQKCPQGGNKMTNSTTTRSTVERKRGDGKRASSSAAAAKQSVTKKSTNSKRSTGKEEEPKKKVPPKPVQKIPELKPSNSSTSKSESAPKEIEKVEERTAVEAEESDSESEIDYQMVSFTEDSPNFFRFVHDPSVPQSSKALGDGLKEDEFDLDTFKFRFAMKPGDKYFELSVGPQETISLPGSDAITKAQEKSIDTQKPKKARDTKTRSVKTVVAASSVASASPKITLPKMDPNTVTSVLDFLHPKSGE